MIPSLNDMYSQSPYSDHHHHHQQEHFQDRTLSSRARSASSSIVSTPSNTFPPYTIKNPLSVQPVTKQNEYDQSRTPQFHGIGNPQAYPNFGDKFPKTLSSENYSPNRQVYRV